MRIAHEEILDHLHRKSLRRDKAPTEIGYYPSGISNGTTSATCDFHAYSSGAGMQLNDLIWFRAAPILTTAMTPIPSLITLSYSTTVTRIGWLSR
jgi:hypothetical protein